MLQALTTNCTVSTKQAHLARSNRDRKRIPLRSNDEYRCETARCRNADDSDAHKDSVGSNRRRRRRSSSSARSRDLQCRTPRKIRRPSNFADARAAAEKPADTATETEAVKITAPSQARCHDSNALLASLLPAVSSLLTCATPETKANTMSSLHCASMCSVTQHTDASTPSPLVLGQRKCADSFHGQGSPCSVTDLQTVALKPQRPTSVKHGNDEQKIGDHTLHHPTFKPFQLSLPAYMLMTSLPSHEQVRNELHRGMPASLLPPKTSSKKFTLVLDLDETLVHCGFYPIPNADIELDIEYAGRPYTVFGRRRPYLETFLKEASQNFELVCFTASQKLYAEQIIKLIDPEGYIEHSLFRDACVNVSGNLLKDLSLLGRDLQYTLLLDNSPHAFSYQVENGVPIHSWFDDMMDTELLATMAWLKTLTSGPAGEVEDVRPFIRSKFRVHEHLAKMSSNTFLSQHINFE